MKYVLIALSMVTASFAGMDSDMTQTDKQQTGYSKLTPQERSQLQNWIDKNYTPRAKGMSGQMGPTGMSPQKTPQTNGKKQGITLQENLKNGGYIRLSDGTLWEVNPGDTPITQGWITPVE